MKIVGRAKLIGSEWHSPHRLGTFHVAWVVYYTRIFRRARKIRTAKAFGVTQ
jgi:hypothetical protein